MKSARLLMTKWELRELKEQQSFKAVARQRWIRSAVPYSIPLVMIVLTSIEAYRLHDLHTVEDFAHVLVKDLCAFVILVGSAVIIIYVAWKRRKVAWSQWPTREKIETGFVVVMLVVFTILLGAACLSVYEFDDNVRGVDQPNGDHSK